MLLARMAVETSPAAVPDDLPDGDIVGALLSLTQTMGQRPDSGPSVVTDQPGTLGRESCISTERDRLIPAGQA